MSRTPFLIQAYNRIFPLKPLNAQQLLLSAQKSIGFSDFGDTNFENRLEFLCKTINEEANLHPFGVFITQERLKGILKNRLRAVKLLQQESKILASEIKPPIIIVGLQRTGTTFLQRLLAADSNNRALRSWEALNPVPFGNKNDVAQRIKQAKISQKALHYISPTFFSIHPVEYDSPEEDVLLNDMTLLSAVAEATMHVPTYSRWVAAQDHNLAYDWMKKMLQILQAETTPKTWVLKTPQHLEYLDVVAQQFPQAVIIHTHRHPKECIPSFCSMVYHSRKIFSKEVDALEVAEHWVNKNVYMLQQAIKTRQNYPNLQVIDVAYQDLVKAPITTAKKIYEQIGRPWSDALEVDFNNALLQNKKDKYGQHHYNKADFGLTDQSIEDTFDFYVKQYSSYL